ncbi:MAG: hypothetical protein ACRCUT_09925, partial [Spirochaetota bacterium]
DEAYLNGYLVGHTGKFPPEYFNAWNTNRFYTFHDSLLKKDEKNILYVKIYINAEGSITGNPGILPENEGRKLYFLNEFVNSEINIYIAFLTFVLSLYHLVLYISRRKDRDNLWYSIVCFLFSIYLANFFAVKIPGFDSLMSYLTFQKIIFISLYCLVLSVAFFIQSFLAEKTLYGWTGCSFFPWRFPCFFF